MQTKPIRTAGAVAAVVAAAGVGYTLRPTPQQTLVAERNPAVEVRTVVIRRTIHIVRHERVRPPVKPAGLPVAGGTTPAGQSVAQTAGQPVAATAVRTKTSHHATTAAPTTGQPVSGQPVSSVAPLKTSTSKHAASGSAPSSSTPSAAGAPGAPLKTKTSSHGGTTKSGPVTTRTSGKGHGDDGGGDGGGDN